MKERNKIPESLFDKVTRAKLPTLIQSTVAICEALTPLAEKLIPLATATVLYNALSVLLGR
jgi:hypothetical protein